MSTKGKLDKNELLSVVLNAAMAGIGAGAFHLINALGDYDYGLYTPIFVAALGVAANVLRKILTSS